MKLNPANKVETIKVKLSKEKTPIAFKNKLEELVESGLSETEARKFISSNPFVLELYYEKDRGLFAVESEALDLCPESICSPYTREYFEE